MVGSVQKWPQNEQTVATYNMGLHFTWRYLHKSDMTLSWTCHIHYKQVINVYDVTLLLVSVIRFLSWQVMVRVRVHVSCHSYVDTFKLSVTPYGNATLMLVPCAGVMWTEGDRMNKGQAALGVKGTVRRSSVVSIQSFLGGTKNSSCPDFELCLTDQHFWLPLPIFTHTHFISWLFVTSEIVTVHFKTCL